MNEDYLWDRSGAPDPEIQDLEKRLAPLRYKHKPELLQPRRNVRRMWWAGAAAAALAVASVAVWQVRQPAAPVTGWEVSSVEGSARLGRTAVVQDMPVRAGQVMTIQLTSRRKVTFIVMTSKTTEVLADNTTSWTGTLPENGDYHILVDADDDRTPYSITISIK